MFVDPNPLLTVAIVLIAGVAGGAAVGRLGLPAITGQILIGVLLGRSGLHLFEHHVVDNLHPLTTFALGLIAVAVGNHLHIRRLHNALRRLSILLVLESTLTPALVFVGVLLLPGTHWTMGALLAAMAISTAPATIVAIVRETRSKGVFVKTLVAAVALNNIACVCLFELAHAFVRVHLDPSSGNSAIDALVAPLRELVASAALGGGIGMVLVVATRRTVRSDRLATASMLAILFTSGLADYLGVSSLLSCVFLGVLLANVTPNKEEIGHRVFQNFESAILAVFFTLAGMELDFAYLVPGGGLALLVVALRLLGKVTAANLAMRLSGATDRVRRYLGPALVPQAGVAVALILLVTEDPVFEPIQQLFLAVALTSVTLNEIIGPILTRYALVRSGDHGRDRARLIDFLHEENITTNLVARSKEEAIARLTDLLISSNHLDVDREELLESILSRERVLSTCIGEGLALPHGVLPAGRSIAGAMGISRAGLDLDAPDGKPVHCMVLLATPPDAEGRHLEVLAALARAVGSDRDIQRQLYNARSAAHAYDLLHAEESEDFNYFLEEDDGR
ncbi:MAG: cation:proton antiporter [Candidatus Eiseniibacteriota bacterium]|jgi:mannitol/fructose-specific phosphotransferase system IIA component (Ntr-type)/Kef-type K+ transport system membrane component KefB